jgi:hypothetical protein
MRSLYFAPFQAAVVFALGVVVGGGFLSGFAQSPAAVAEPMITSRINSTCSSGDDVADFVCRNTWLANTRHSYR